MEYLAFCYLKKIFDKNSKSYILLYKMEITGSQSMASYLKVDKLTNQPDAINLFFFPFLSSSFASFTCIIVMIVLILFSIAFIRVNPSFKILD